MIRPHASLAGFIIGLGLTQASCSPAPQSPAVSQADAVARSKAAADAERFAPQAHAAAEKLRAEAKWLQSERRTEEAEAASEQAIAAYNEAFALARSAQAEERIEAARARRSEAAKELARLDQLQGEIAAEADAFEMRARVHLDKEEVADVDQLSPDRARARRTAAKYLAAEARLLCLAADLLDPKSAKLNQARQSTSEVEKDLSVGSINKDLYPRAAAVRGECLEVLTNARRERTKKAPQSADSDRLLADLSDTGQVFAFRDDRGIVINVGKPLDDSGTLTDQAAKILKLLAGTSKAHTAFPLMLVAHTAQSGQDKIADAMISTAKAALESAGARVLSTEKVLGAQPVVSASLRGAAEKNERLEIVFVVPGR